jgi:hypothetical protein
MADGLAQDVHPEFKPGYHKKRKEIMKKYVKQSQ